MRVRVLFFGMLRDLVGGAEEEIELPESASARDVITHYEATVPHLKDMLSCLALAVNQQYAKPDARLKANDEVALLPPVSGGAPPIAGEAPAANHRCSITRGRIDTERVLNDLKRGEDGAALVFEGVVRNQTRGRRTLFLEYDAYEEMALRQMQELAEQAMRQFQIRDLAVVHRLGRLEIGETSVLIAVASAHRGPAFDACRWLIDTLKRTVPIWKKEHFADGAVWADGEPFPPEIPRANS